MDDDVPQMTTGDISTTIVMSKRTNVRRPIQSASGQLLLLQLLQLIPTAGDGRRLRRMRRGYTAALATAAFHVRIPTSFIEAYESLRG